MNTKNKLPLLSISASLLILGHLSVNAATLIQLSITATT